MFSSLFSFVTQTNLKDAKWELIGFTGAPISQKLVAYQKDAVKEISDTADANISYFTKEIINGSEQLVYLGHERAGASIGLFAIQNSTSPSGQTTLKNSLNTRVRLKIIELKEFNSEIPNYRMYVNGRDSNIIRIDYQADYEGGLFRVKFGNEAEDYVAHFNYNNTFSNPAILKTYSEYSLNNLSSTSAKIIDSIDFSANDNNWTKMSINGGFKVKGSNGNYGEDLTNYQSSDDYNVTVYTVKNGVWKLFNSLSKTSSNDFNSFNVGQGYWLKANNARSRGIFSTAQTALISINSLNIDKVYSEIKNGWHLMSFNDINIAHSLSYIFIPQAVIRNDLGVIIYRLQSFGNHRHSIPIPKTLFGKSNKATKSSESARYVNIYAKEQEEIFGHRDRIRAIPAIKVEESGKEVDGIIVFSDTKFSINTRGSIINLATTLSGRMLNKLPSSSGYETIYGEHTNFINLGGLSNVKINTLLSLKMPKYSPSPVLINDLNDASKKQKASNILASINKLSTKERENKPSTSNAVYLIDLDFNANLDYSDINNHDTILIASGARISTSLTSSSLAKDVIGSKYAFQDLLDVDISFNREAIDGIGDFGGLVRSSEKSSVIETKTSIQNKFTKAHKLVYDGNLMINEGGLNIQKSQSLKVYGSLVVYGGLEIDGNLSIGGDLDVNGPAISIKQTATLIVKGDVNINHPTSGDFNLLTDTGKVYIRGTLSATGAKNKIGINNYKEDRKTLTLAQKQGTDYLEKNILGVPVGLYDAKGKPFPSNTNYSKPNKTSMLDILRQQNKEIKTILSSHESSVNQQYWRMIDFRKDVNMLYGYSYDSDDVNENEGIFHLYSNKGYWVNIEDISLIDSNTSHFF